jgi:ferric-dicitrate binding protein FerR (iron transport regulator)
MKNHLRVDNTYTNHIEDKIVSVLTGQASQEELAEVRQWLAESANNRKLYDEYTGIWGISCAVGRNDDYQSNAAWTLLNRRMKTRKNYMQPTIPWKKVMLVAAMLAIVFLAGTSVTLFTGKATEQSPLMFTEYSSPYGSKSMVKLPDGSSVWLNAGSMLR